MASIQRLNTTDIRNAISHIREKQDVLIETCLVHENKHSLDSEIQLVLAASDCEIEMTNFARDIREKLSAGVVT